MEIAEIMVILNEVLIAIYPVMITVFNQLIGYGQEFA